jgi:hypothetical protein
MDFLEGNKTAMHLHKNKIKTEHLIHLSPPLETIFHVQITQHNEIMGFLFLNLYVFRYEI